VQLIWPLFLKKVSVSYPSGGVPLSLQSRGPRIVCPPSLPPGLPARARALPPPGRSPPRTLSNDPAPQQPRQGRLFIKILACTKAPRPPWSGSATRRQLARRGICNPPPLYPLLLLSQKKQGRHGSPRAALLNTSFPRRRPRPALSRVSSFTLTPHSSRITHHASRITPHANNCASGCPLSATVNGLLLGEYSTWSSGMPSA
jgi:hypothetical protein